MSGNIPINPSQIAGAVLYTVPSVATPTGICQQPSEGAAIVPMAFTFQNNTVWNVDLSSITPINSFSKVSCMYVDASKCSHDVNILFQDTGFQFVVSQGDTQLVPVLASKALPKFYVILDSSNETSATDQVNIIAANFFLPPSSNLSILKNIAYGYSQMFELQPTFTQSTAFSTALSYTGEDFSQTIIDNTQWYITSININYYLAGADNGFFRIDLLDAGNIFYTFFGPTLRLETTDGVLIDMSGLNYISSGNGPLTFQYTATNDSTITGAINIGGGVLVT